MNLQAMKELRKFAVNLAETLPEELYDQDGTWNELYEDHEKPNCGCFLHHFSSMKGEDLYPGDHDMSSTEFHYLGDTKKGIISTAKELNLPLPTSFTAWDVVDRIDNLVDKYHDSENSGL